ncbi:hypothetical protein ACE6H2_013261 [Prunus campanulata]
MLWCSHCGVLVPPMRDDHQFVSCSGCGKVLIYRDASTSEPTLVKSSGRKGRRAGSSLKSVSSDNSQSFEGLWSKRAVGANPPMLLKIKKDYENVKEGGDGRLANYKSPVPNQENVHESTYDADCD